MLTRITIIIRTLVLRMSGREYIVSGQCRMCGKCCRRINLRYRGGWIKKKSQFQELLQEQPEYSRFTLLEDPQRGGYLEFSCSLHDHLHGCLDYENRLDICKDYPRKTLLLHGGRLLHGCGYTIKTGVPFKAHLQKELKRCGRK